LDEQLSVLSTPPGQNALVQALNSGASQIAAGSAKLAEMKETALLLDRATSALIAERQIANRRETWHRGLMALIVALALGASAASGWWAWNAKQTANINTQWLVAIGAKIGVR
jgi:X-X-X-Leu-X-X-Gly heptad repeat protein